MTARRILPGLASIVTAIALLSFDVDPVEAHRTRSFQACVSAGEGLRCHSSYAVLPGTTVYLRGRVRPRHRDEIVRIRRRRPEASRWKVVGTTNVRQEGRMSWSWDTTSDHVDRNDPWRFKFVINDHGVSNVVRLYVSDRAE